MVHEQPALIEMKCEEAASTIEETEKSTWWKSLWISC
jgi:hypothetical protein